MSVSKWATSFYYQQDLRSYYMNNLLNASLNPGVYNADIAIFAAKSSDTSSTVDSTYSKQAGLNLFIKKGTTFLFSNNYKQVTENCVERDLDNIGTFLLKSVALEDIIYPISPIKNDSSPYFLGQGEKSEALKIYVVARMTYNPDNLTNVEEPEFYLYIDNPLFNAENSGASDSEKYKYFSKNGSEGKTIPLPDGMQAIKDDATSKQIAYLMLGVILPIEGGGCYLNSSKEWVSDGASIWNGKHVFTACGLPDYRHPLASDNLNMVPDIMIGIGNSHSEAFKTPKYNKVFLDLRKSILNGKVVENIIDIKNIYCWGANSYAGDDPNKLSASISTISTANLPQGYHVACDFLYLSSQLKNSSREDNLTSILSTSNPCKLRCYSWMSDVTKAEYSNLEANSSAVKENMISVTEVMGTSSNALEWDKIFAEGVLPLDLSKTNQTRLLNFIKNKDVLSAVVNKIRHTDNDASADTIVPVALILRAFEIDSKGNIIYIDNCTGSNSFNPLNILNFLNLQFKAHKINSLSSIIEPYSILPTLE